jgi:hypothetical protein
MPRLKEKKKPARENAFYVIEINDWKHSYSFSLNDNERLKELFGPGLYRDHNLLVLSGILLEPQKIAGKDLVVNLFGSRDIVRVLEKPEGFPHASAKAVGGLTIRGKTREYCGSIPMDIFTVIANMLAVEKVKYITMFGQSLYRGKAEIHSINFEETYDQEDFE